MTLRLLIAVLILAGAQAADWPAAVPGFTAPGADEHPRLFFRVGEVAGLQARALTPAGAATVARMRLLIDGANGDTLPAIGSGWTFWHGAAYGMLYQLTGQQVYADLAQQSVERMRTAGVTDKDTRYSLNPPNEEMRTGPALSAMAMAYDLCFTGWTPTYRQQIAVYMQNYSGTCSKNGHSVSLQSMATNAYKPNNPSNHFPLQVAGAGLVLMAIGGDTGTDTAKTTPWLAGVQTQTSGQIFATNYGANGYFHEHHGPGKVGSTWTLLPWMQAQRVCAGKEWCTPEHPAALWTVMHLAFETVTYAGSSPVGPYYLNPMWPVDGYGYAYLTQDGGHHAAYFCEGLGAVPASYRPALRWTYDTFVAPHESTNYGVPGPTRDVFNYPHRGMFSLINWPDAAANPSTVLPHASHDPVMGRLLVRNRWQDGDDIAVAVMAGARSSGAENVYAGHRLMLHGLGLRLGFGNLTGASGAATTLHRSDADGTSVMSTTAGGGWCAAVDVSGTCGAPLLIVLSGAATADVVGDTTTTKHRVQSIDLGGSLVRILTLSTASHPTAQVNGSTITIGGRTISLAAGVLTLGASNGAPAISAQAQAQPANVILP